MTGLRGIYIYIRSQCDDFGTPPWVEPIRRGNARIRTTRSSMTIFVLIIGILQGYKTFVWYYSCWKWNSAKPNLNSNIFLSVIVCKKTHSLLGNCSLGAVHSNAYSRHDEKFRNEERDFLFVMGMDWSNLLTSPDNAWMILFHTRNKPTKFSSAFLIIDNDSRKPFPIDKFHTLSLP